MCVWGGAMGANEGLPIFGEKIKIRAILTNAQSEFAMVVVDSVMVGSA